MPLGLQFISKVYLFESIFRGGTHTCDRNELSTFFEEHTTFTQFIYITKNPVFCFAAFVDSSHKG